MLTNQRISLKPYFEYDCILRKNLSQSGLSIPNDSFSYGYGASYDADDDVSDYFLPITSLDSTDEFIVKSNTKKLRFYVVGDGRSKTCQLVTEVDPDYCDTATCPESSPCCTDCDGVCCVDGECTITRKSNCDPADWRGCLSECPTDGDICSDQTGACCIPDAECENCITCENGYTLTTCEEAGGSFSGSTTCEKVDCEDTSGCNCQTTACCFYDADGVPIGCSEDVTKQQCEDAGGNPIANCDLCTGFCSNGDKLVYCCRPGVGCNARCRECSGGQEYTTPTECTANCDGIQGTYQCKSVAVGNNGCGYNQCVFVQNSDLGYEDAETCGKNCDTCDGWEDGFGNAICLCEPGVGCGAYTGGPVGNGDLVCCSCCGDCGVIPRIQDDSLDPENPFGLSTAISTYYLSIGIRKPIRELDQFTPAQLADSKTASSARISYETPEVYNEEAEFAGTSTCNMCYETDVETTRMYCNPGKPPILIQEYDFSEMCENDEIKIRVNRTGILIKIEIWVKWFGYEAEQGIDEFVMETRDYFRMPTASDGVIPDSIQQLCTLPCGLTYECYPATDGTYNFSPPYETYFDGKLLNVRSIPDRLSPEYPSRVLTTKILGKGEAFPYTMYYEDNNSVQIPTITTEGLIDQAQSDTIFAGNYSRLDGYDGRYIGTTFDLGNYGQTCTCNALGGCGTEDIGVPVENTGFIMVVGTGITGY